VAGFRLVIAAGSENSLGSASIRQLLVAADFATGLKDLDAKHITKHRKIDLPAPASEKIGKLGVREQLFLILETIAL
jgi:hypothetical protein